MSTTNPNPNPTPAQEEFQSFLDKNTDQGSRVHPEDRHHRDDDDDDDNDDDDEDVDEEDQYRDAQIDAAMRTPNLRSEMKLPPASFDSGHGTGVKGVIADARAYEEAARQGKWRNKVRAARRSVFSFGDAAKASEGGSQPGSDEEVDPDEEAFMRQWREARRRELENEARNGIRNRKTSPSLRMYGQLEEVHDAAGYLDAIEKVSRNAIVVVFIYDDMEDSRLVGKALRTLASTHPHVRFVKVPYEQMEVDQAGVPTLLAYREQGELFANMTGLIDMIPEDEYLDAETLCKLLQQKGVL
ncbi:thioredoxin-like protein [Xylariomycetidae sp. FL0641]|nr:thioredoxin-like protein [Xylariomycetidae sp. FL0641]